ncbi:ATP-binding cassette subfamily C protein [Rhizobium sp. BK077]|uniref:type I secretion system permease/ATPase n=1 Tax=unclassified Rhizobium TaxID=2613769 RepID=UPI00161F66E6|nr:MULTISPECIES: type I secretion system permease/ATPase [unclassified Rhizobium]MBB3302952.1 ATP-binding cassette subfamily C protein [Rhizobium sp. BK112]MBB3371845.1 ATP-binding cassette subfamily C protein [Rhizobium sp. BK077]MBB4182812.1 ATP-binding cassette subfamily C protein [Rhizobium sp. BK109]
MTKKNNAPRYKIGGFRGIFIYLFGLSGIINILALTGAFYMMQIYDRALTSGSISTLVALSILAIGLYLFQGFFDIIRSQILIRLGARLDVELSPLAHKVVIEMPRYGYSTSEAMERGRDVDTLRGFLASQGPIALFDLPWMPLYLIFVWLLHPMLGMMTVGGAAVLALLTIIAEVLTRRHSQSMVKASVARNSIVDSNARNSEVLHAMGITQRAVERFETANRRHLECQTTTSDIGGTLSGLSKVMRMMLQSAILGLGAYLAIRGDLSAGSIIASSIVTARALAPVDQAIAHWKSVVGARRSHNRLTETLAVLNDTSRHVELPTPHESLTIDNITTVAPTTGAVLLSEVSLRLNAGQALGLIGPSGGGKTTLARSMLGIWPVLRGSVRIDGADLGQWTESFFHQHVGYLPQDVALMDGTIADNISRFAEIPDARKIIRAAKNAGIHEMIVHLRDGYQTELGPHGTALSAGQRQRIALARALYGDPFLIVLDEPNSNLDAEGEEALTRVIAKVRERGGIVVIVAHRPSALQAVDMVGLVQNGRLVAFGPKDEIVQPTKMRPLVVDKTATPNLRAMPAE